MGAAADGVGLLDADESVEGAERTLAPALTTVDGVGMMTSAISALASSVRTFFRSTAVKNLFEYRAGC